MQFLRHHSSITKPLTVVLMWPGQWQKAVAPAGQHHQPARHMYSKQMLLSTSFVMMRLWRCCLLNACLSPRSTFLPPRFMFLPQLRCLILSTKCSHRCSTESSPWLTQTQIHIGTSPLAELSLGKLFTPHVPQSHVLRTHHAGCTLSLVVRLLCPVVLHVSTLYIVEYCLCRCTGLPFV